VVPIIKWLSADHPLSGVPIFEAFLRIPPVKNGPESGVQPPELIQGLGRNYFEIFSQY